MKDLIKRYFANGIKSKRTRRVGVEVEHFIIDRNGRAVVYSGEGGICEIIRRHMAAFPLAKPIYDSVLIGFETEEFSVTIEPGCQYEISIMPFENLSEIQRIYDNFKASLETVLADYEYRLINEGCHPTMSAADITLIPKKRYEYMDKYFAGIGSGGMEMMRTTASTQISVDYYSEKDCVQKMRAAMLFTPVFQLMTDNTHSNKETKTVPYLRRADIWRRVDKGKRADGPDLFAEDFGFDTYADFILSAPLIVKKRGDKTEYVGETNASDAYADETLNEAIANHVTSIFFFDVRLRTYIEIRGADALPKNLMLSYAALIKGLFYSQEFIKFSEEIIKNCAITMTDIRNAKECLMYNGWDAKIYGYEIASLAEKLIRIAESALSENEAKYLLPLSNKISLKE